MTNQIKNMVLRRRGGQKRVGEERIEMTKLSTFKPKPLRNPQPPNKHTEPTLKISSSTRTV